MSVTMEDVAGLVRLAASSRAVMGTLCPGVRDVVATRSGVVATTVTIVLSSDSLRGVIAVESVDSVFLSAGPVAIVRAEVVLQSESLL